VVVFWVYVLLGFVCFDRIFFGISCFRGLGFDCCSLGVDCVVAAFGCNCFRCTIALFLSSFIALRLILCDLSCLVWIGFCLGCVSFDCVWYCSGSCFSI
jgi:hypothetical protein